MTRVRPRQRTEKRRDNWVASIDRIVFTMKHRPSRWDHIVDTPAKVARLIRDIGVFPDDGKEHAGMLMLNTALCVLAWHPIGTGTVDGVLITPRDVFGPALRVLGTRAVIVVHNHPSGDATPSKRDIDVTVDLYQTGEIIDITLHDHVILADRPRPGDPPYASIALFVKAEGAGAGQMKEE